MNVYKKLQEARVRLQGMPLKESGNNKFAGYTYMELGDFLPQINGICAEVGLCGVISFGEDATLTIINSDKPEESIVFHYPIGKAELKGCHEIQNIGASSTYLRRYLWVTAFDITEHDALDSTHGKADIKAPVPPPTATPVVDSKDAEHLQRVKNALRTIYGDNFKEALDKVEELTSFIPKGKTEAERVAGTRKFDQLKGQRLTILCSTLEKLALAKTLEDTPA